MSGSQFDVLMAFVGTVVDAVAANGKRVTGELQEVRDRRILKVTGFKVVGWDLKILAEFGRMDKIETRLVGGDGRVTIQFLK